jgi:hypothetical protein
VCARSLKSVIRIHNKTSHQITSTQCPLHYTDSRAVQCSFSTGTPVSYSEVARFESYKCHRLRVFRDFSPSFHANDKIHVHIQHSLFTVPCTVTETVTSFLFSRFGYKIGSNALKTTNRTMLYVFFWVIPRGLNFIYRRFGTLCLFHLHRQVGK